MDVDINAIRAKHEGPVAAAKAELKVKLDHLETWADANPEVFGNKRSLEMMHGTIGWRKGNPSVKQLRGHTVAETIKTLAEKAKQFIRTVLEIDREAILAAHSTDMFKDDTLKTYGLQVTQDETFYIDPKLENQDA